MPTTDKLHRLDKLFLPGATLAVLLFLAPASLLAQTQVDCKTPQPPTTPVQVDNAESTSKPDAAQLPEANPSRPTITNPAHIPPVGYLQFEQGFLQANGSPSGLDHQFSLNQAIRLSLHPRLMLEFESQPFALTREDATPDAPAASQSDPGDLILGVQGLAIKEVGRIPTIAGAYLQRVRSGTAPDLDIGSFSRSAVILVSGDLGDFHYDSNFSGSEQQQVLLRRAQYGQTLSITHDLFSKALHQKLELTGELWHFSQPLVTATRSGTASPRSNAVGTLWALGYTLRPNVVLDAGLNHGLTSTSTDWQGFAGFTYVFPHRLWPHQDNLPQSLNHRHVHRR
ncbi:transporter [Granulicella sibirica]|uniref:transporter n=1 Tax=Granulicella sibirica TaxID=2479048 RepID=UPI001008C055|nr:transporter [Granulicella sibirica]